MNQRRFDPKGLKRRFLITKKYIDMFKSTEVVSAYKSLIGWRQHHDTQEVIIPDELTQSETGEYYQQKHPALALDIIQTLIPPTLPIEDYLTNTVSDSTNEIFNDILQYRQVNEYGKTLLSQSVLLNKVGWVNDKITNQGRFVGLQVATRDVMGLQAVINEVGFQFAGEESFTLYLFHASQVEPIKTLEVVTNGNPYWNWRGVDWELSLSDSDYRDGIFIIGYYQDEISTNAINYTNFNWDRGVCGGCNDSHISVWRDIRRNFLVYPIYVPAGSFVQGEMFDMKDAFYSNDQSFGLNLKFTVRCDLTNFFVQNRFAFKNLLSLKVVYRILNDMKFSQQINAIEQNIKMMIIRDLEGDVDTKLTNIPTQYRNELKAVSFNISGISPKCLPCESQNKEPVIGVV